MELTQRELLLVITNFILFVIAIFLFLQLRRTGKKSEPKKAEQSELKGIADLKPEEFKPERFDLKPHDEVPAKAAGFDAAPKIEAQDIKFEEDIEDIRSVVPVKKTSRKKKTAKKAPQAAPEGVVNEAAPVKKASRKKKGVKVEPEVVAQGVIKELSEITPEKKTRRKKKTVKTEPVVDAETSTKELIEAATVKLDINRTMVPVQEVPAVKMGMPVQEVPAVKMGMPVQEVPAVKMGMPVQEVPAVETDARETAPVQEAPAIKTEPVQANLNEKKGQVPP